MCCRCDPQMMKKKKKEKEKKRKIEIMGVSIVAQWVKDPELSL